MAATPEPPRPSAIALSPVALAWAVNMTVALLAGFGLHLTAGQAGAAETTAAALVALITALTARPWYIPAITGAAASLLTACAAFGLHWDAEQVSAAATALSVVLMLVAHSAAIPTAAARQGLTATEIMLSRHQPAPDQAASPGRPGTAPPLQGRHQRP
jgi:hypothetical protein